MVAVLVDESVGFGCFSVVGSVGYSYELVFVSWTDWGLLVFAPAAVSTVDMPGAVSFVLVWLPSNAGYSNIFLDCWVVAHL